jgi:hypothetical protein
MGFQSFYLLVRKELSRVNSIQLNSTFYSAMHTDYIIKIIRLFAKLRLLLSITYRYLSPFYNAYEVYNILT